MKYPMEIYSHIINTKNGKSVFSVEALFSALSPEKIGENEREGKECFPLKIFSPYSVFKCSIIHNGNGMFVNLKPQKTDALLEKVRFFNNLHMSEKIKCLSKPVQEQNASLPPCQTMTFRAGKLKGKTPATVLLESSDGVSVIESQINWLTQHLQQYPQNQTLINACKEALTLYRKGQLSSVQPALVSEIPVYVQEWKADIYHPIKENRTTYYKGSRMGIYFQRNSQSAYSIVMENVIAPIQKKEDGTVTITVSAAQENSYKKNTHYIGADDLIECVSEMKRQIDCFYDMYYKHEFKIALEHQERNRTGAGQ